MLLLAHCLPVLRLNVSDGFAGWRITTKGFVLTRCVSLFSQIWATLLGVNFTAEVVAGPFVFDQLVVESLFIREAQQLRINEFSQCHEVRPCADLHGSGVSSFSKRSCRPRRRTCLCGCVSRLGVLAAYSSYWMQLYTG